MKIINDYYLSVTDRMKMRSLVFFLVLMFFPLRLICQYSGMIHYTVKDGLPSSTVYTTTQDSLGYMWMGTEAGLVRFDGAKFKVFTTRDGLPDNEVLGLMFDKVTSRMWVITYSRAACYYRNGQFYTSKNDSSLRSITCDVGEFINGNMQPGVGVFLYNGFNVYKCANDIITKFKLGYIGVQIVHQDDDSSYDVLLSTTGVVRHSLHAETICSDFSADALFGKGQWINNKFCLFKQGAIAIYQKGERQYQRVGSISIANEFPTNIICLKDKYYISVPEFGVYVVDTSLNEAPYRIWTGKVNDIANDDEGNIWITTNDDGVYVIRSKRLLNYNNLNGLLHDNVTAINEGIKGIYFGNTYGELYCLHDGIMAPIDIQSKFRTGRIRQILSCDSNIFFISKDIGYFNEFNHHLYEVHHQSGGPKAILRSADSKTILIGLSGSIDYLNIATNDRVEVTYNKRILAMAKHPNGTIYCGSLDGVYILQGDTMIHAGAEGPELQNRVTSLCFTPDSILWIGTPSSGIIAYNGKKVIAHISNSIYMSYTGAICRKVISGARNEIWVATNSGINNIRYHLTDSVVVDNITPINTLDGLLSDDVNDILIKDSLIYVATSHGLSVLNIKQLSKDAAAPIYISSFRINDKDSVIHGGIYDLAYWQNNLKIEYVGVLLPAAGDIRYQYRLLGSGSDKWETTTNTSIEFRSLSAGEYTFEVVVLDKFGNSSKHLARVRFNITQAFYYTFWFWAIIVIVILAFGFFIIRSIFERRKQQYEKEQSYTNKIIDLEQQALKAQMNPHFIFNCLTAIQHFVNKEDVYSANMYLSNFAKLIRKTLDLSGEQYITLDKEVAYLENYIQLEKMRFQEQFNYFITVGNEVDVFSVQIPPMLLQPIIENAIRHGLRYKDNNEGVLNIRFDKMGEAVICEVDDNGIGIRRSRELKTNTHVEYQSKGMKLTESRIAAINMISEKKISMEVKDKYDELGNAVGTLVVIYFSQGSNHVNEN